MKRRPWRAMLSVRCSHAEYAPTLALSPPCSCAALHRTPPTQCPAGTACHPDNYQQFATVGAIGKRKYGDFNAMMSKGGSMDSEQPRVASRRDMI